MKVKSIDKLERLSDGATVRYSALVTYTDGLKDTQIQVQGEQINPANRTKEEVDVFLKTAFQAAVVVQAKALDDAVVETAKMDTLKTTLMSDLTKAGLTVALALLVWLAPVVGWAGDLYPEWTAMTNLTTAAGVSLSGLKPTYIGVIDNSAYYVVEINVNWEESGNNPSNTAGVSLYAQSGTTVGAIPFMVSEISSTDYTNNYDQTKPNAGVTKTFIIENIPYISIGIGKNVADADTFHVRYRRMKGKY